MIKNTSGNHRDRKIKTRTVLGLVLGLSSFVVILLTASGLVRAFEAESVEKSKQREVVIMFIEACAAGNKDYSADPYFYSAIRSLIKPEHITTGSIFGTASGQTADRDPLSLSAVAGNYSVEDTNTSAYCTDLAGPAVSALYGGWPQFFNDSGLFKDQVVKTGRELKEDYFLKLYQSGSINKKPVMNADGVSVLRAKAVEKGFYNAGTPKLSSGYLNNILHPQFNRCFKETPDADPSQSIDLTNDKGEITRYDIPSTIKKDRLVRVGRVVEKVFVAGVDSGSRDGLLSCQEFLGIMGRSREAFDKKIRPNLSAAQIFGAAMNDGSSEGTAECGAEGCAEGGAEGGLDPYADPCADPATRTDPNNGNCFDCTDPGNKDAKECSFTRSITVPIVNILSAIVGVVIVLSIVVAGIQYITAGGNSAQVAQAKARIGNAILALVLYIFGFALLQWLIPGGIFH